MKNVLPNFMLYFSNADDWFLKFFVLSPDTETYFMTGIFVIKAKFS